MDHKVRHRCPVGALCHVLVHLEVAGVEPRRERLERGELVGAGIKFAQPIRRHVILVVDENSLRVRAGRGDGDRAVFRKRHRLR